MSISDAHLRGMRRTVLVGLLSIGTIVGGAVSPGVADAVCTESDWQVSKNDKCMAADPGTVQGGFGSNPASVAPPQGEPPIVDVQPSTMRAFCAISACFLITDWPRAGVGGKT